jgi:hypothetical protein
MYRCSCHKLVSVQENTVESTTLKIHCHVNLTEQRFHSLHIVLTRPDIHNFLSVQDFILFLVASGAPDAHVSRQSKTLVLALRLPTHTCAVVSLVECDLAPGVTLVLQARSDVVVVASSSLPVVFQVTAAIADDPGRGAAGQHEEDHRGLHNEEVDKVWQTRLCEKIELLDAIEMSASYNRVWLFLLYVDIMPSALPDGKPWEYFGMISILAKGLYRTVFEHIFRL